MVVSGWVALKFDGVLVIHAGSGSGVCSASEVVIWFIWDICSCFIISKYLYRRTYVYYVPSNNYFCPTWDTYVRYGFAMSDI